MRTQATAWFTTKTNVDLEVRIKGLAHYLLAELPPPHLADLKGAIIQQRFSKHCASPEALFEAIPDLKPSVDKLFEPIEFGWVRPTERLTGHFKILNMDHLQQLPKFPRDQFYHFPEIVKHGVEGAVQQSRQEGGVLQSVAPAYIPHVANTCTLQDVWM